MVEKRIKVCYFGTYRAAYSRNKIMIEGLRRNGVEVLECHETLLNIYFFSQHDCADKQCKMLHGLLASCDDLPAFFTC